MASLPSLLRFCDFLEQRVHTLSLSLLRRFLTEFCGGHEHSLLEFMRLGASVVAVMPVERTSRRRRREAARLLAQEPFSTNQTAALTTNSQSRVPVCVFRFLLARVATKNILWLRDMFQEFGHGQETLLHEFVSRGDETISVVPVDIQALGMLPLPPPPLLRDSTTAAVASVGTIVASTTSKQKRSTTEELGDKENNRNDGPCRKVRRTSASTQGTGAKTAVPKSPVEMVAFEDLRKRILNVLARITAQRPWTKAFSAADLPCPFSRVQHPELAAALDSFWENHAQAVWERNFWAPLSRKRCRETHSQRRARQAKAQQGFEATVMIPAYKELGAAFFVQLDQLPEPHKGWWYLGNVEDLFTMAQSKGLIACVQYMESQAFARYPKSPGGGRRFFSMRNGESNSMWSSTDNLQHALREIRALKEAKNKPTVE